MYENQFLKSLGITLATETAVLFIVVRHFFLIHRAKIPHDLLLFSGIVASGLTLPYVWFVLPAYIRNHGAYVTTSELSVLLMETVIYRFILSLDLKRCFVLSVAANLSSFLFGLLLFK